MADTMKVGKVLGTNPSESSDKKISNKTSKENTSGGILKQIKDSAIGKIVEKVVEEILPYAKKGLTALGTISSIIASILAKLTTFDLVLLTIIFILLAVCLLLIYMLILYKQKRKDSSGDKNE